MSQACAGADIVYLILLTLVGDMENVMFRSFLQAATAPGSSVRHVVYFSGVDPCAPPASSGRALATACGRPWPCATSAAAAAAVITNPEPHAGKIYTLTTEAVTDKMIAEKISKVTGQSVRHVNITPEEHTDLILKNLSGRSSAQKPEEFASGLVTLDWEKLRMNLFSKVYPDLENLIGREGMSLEAFLAEHADAFKQQAPHQSD